MKNNLTLVCLIAILPVFLTDCTGISEKTRQRVEFQPGVGIPQAVSDLEGSWTYKDTAGEGTILINNKGFGRYDWKDGRFVTESLRKGVWKGRWIQNENDREGGFELTFSESANLAEGRWWYTRIGKDHDPFDPGGTFSMSRVSSGKVETLEQN